MKAMILSAGLGERLRPLTLELPKPMAPVGNTPLIEYTLRLLKRYGIHEIAINLHHRGDAIQEYLRDGSNRGMKIVYSQEPVLLGTGGAIRRMRAFLGTEPFLVINADILAPVDLRKLAAYHHAQGALATMVLRPNPDPVRYGTIETDASGRIREFLGKIRSPLRGLRKWMFTGIHLMDPAALDAMPDREIFCINRDVYAQWIREDRPCCGYVHEGYWRDLGTLADYLRANLDLLEDPDLREALALETRPQARPQNVTLNPPCLIAEDAVIGGGAVLGPGAVIGAGVRMGDHSQVAESVVWPGARIGDREHLFRMIVTPHQRLRVPPDFPRPPTAPTPRFPIS